MPSQKKTSVRSTWCNWWKGAALHGWWSSEGAPLSLWIVCECLLCAFIVSFDIWLNQSNNVETASIKAPTDTMQRMDRQEPHKKWSESLVVAMTTITVALALFCVIEISHLVSVTWRVNDLTSAGRSTQPRPPIYVSYLSKYGSEPYQRSLELNFFKTVSDDTTEEVDPESGAIGFAKAHMVLAMAFTVMPVIATYF